MSYLQMVFPFLILSIVCGALRGGTRNGKLMVILPAVTLFFWTWPPFAWLLAGTLEWQYPVATMPRGDAAAMVILGGGVYPSNQSQPEPLLAQDSFLRCQHAVWLYQHWHPVPIAVSGGPVQDRVIVSALMREMLEAEGVPPPLIWTEGHSTSTYENAVRTAELLRARGIHKIALVTEAYHMSRAVQCFRRQGFDVVPAPCSYRTLEFRFDMSHFIPGAKSVISNENVIHEWIGLAWYKLSGKI
jgi:uncharacterized SAM-binding protein YcdF (DUF218 family)